MGGSPCNDFLGNPNSGIKNNNNKPASIFTLGKVLNYNAKKPQIALSDPIGRGHTSHLCVPPPFPKTPVVSNLGRVLLDNCSSAICSVSSSGGAMIPTLWMRKLEAQRGSITHPSSCSGGRDTKPISSQSRIYCRTLVKKVCNKCCFSLNLCNGTAPPGTEPSTSAVEAGNLNHWTSREANSLVVFIKEKSDSKASYKWQRHLNHVLHFTFFSQHFIILVYLISCPSDTGWA